MRSTLCRSFVSTNCARNASSFSKSYGSCRIFSSKTPKSFDAVSYTHLEDANYYKCADMLHLTEEGYRKCAAQAAKYILEALGEA